MADPRQTVESIRAFLGSQSNSASAQLVAVAADYAELCRQANLRLRRCSDFLRDGFRTEALAYASTRPPLIDLVSELQFRELPDWERTCTSLGLARPTRLAADAAATLVQASHLQEPLKELLVKHRYLALSRADLHARLDILRQLIEADPGNPCWKREAEELTQARVATLRNDATAAVRSGDVAAIDKLLAELDSGMIAAPPDLRDGLARASASLREVTAVAELRALVPQVRSAVGAMSHDQCQQIFAQWSRIVRESRVSVPPDLRQEILPLSQLLDGWDDHRDHQREFRSACAGLSQAMNDNVPLEQLTRLYRTAVGFELEIPEDLESSYRRALEAAQGVAQKEQRKQFALGGVLVGFIVIGLLVLTYVIFWKH